MFILAVV